MTSAALDRAAEHPSDGADGAPEPIDVEVLGAQIVAGAAKVASTTAAWVEMVGVFDAANGAGRLWMDSTAQWLTFACSMSAGTAREHVRIARALREMPVVAQAFGNGVLSFSKVRECTRLVGQIDEDALVTVARDFTAAQLERAVRGFRAGRTERLVAEVERKVTHRELSDGGVQITAVLPAEEAAVVLNALEVARARYHDEVDAATEAAQPILGEDDPSDDPNIVPVQPYVWERDGESLRRVPLESTEQAGPVEPQIPCYTRADALVDVARGFLAAGPADVSGEDRDLVVIHIDARDLDAAAPPGASPDVRADDVPAGTRPDPDIDPAAQADDVPAGTRPDPDIEPDAQADDVPAGTRPEPDIEPAAQADDVPAGTRPDPAVDPEGALRPRAGWIENAGWVHSSTAARLMCTAAHQHIVIGEDGEALHLGRTQRLVSRAQRRALMARDRTCRFPGCVRAIRLHAHHILYWSIDGPTDIENLILLCHHHHVVVHAASITITKRRGAPGHTFTRVGGTLITAQSRDYYSQRSALDGDLRPFNDQVLLRELAADARALDETETGRRRVSEHDVPAPPPSGWDLPAEMECVRERTNFYDYDHNVFPRWGGERVVENDYWELLEPRATTRRTNPEARY